MDGRTVGITAIIGKQRLSLQKTMERNGVNAASMGVGLHPVTSIVKTG